MRILSLLALISEQCGIEVSRNRLAFVSDALKGYPAPKVIDALQRIAMNARRFPTPGEILSEMGIKQLTAEEHGVQAAAQILACIRRYGHTGTPEEVQSFLGPLAWQVVQDLQGWAKAIEEVDNENLTTMMAQWRRIGEVTAKANPDVMDAANAFLMGSRQPPVLKIVENKKVEKKPEARSKGITLLGDLLGEIQSKK